MQRGSSSSSAADEDTDVDISSRVNAPRVAVCDGSSVGNPSDDGTSIGANVFEQLSIADEASVATVLPEPPHADAEAVRPVHRGGDRQPPEHMPPVGAPPEHVPAPAGHDQHVAQQQQQQQQPQQQQHPLPQQQQQGAHAAGGVQTRATRARQAPQCVSPPHSSPNANDRRANNEDDDNNDSSIADAADPDDSTFDESSGSAPASPDDDSTICYFPADPEAQLFTKWHDKVHPGVDFDTLRYSFHPDQLEELGCAVLWSLCVRGSSFNKADGEYLQTEEVVQVCEAPLALFVHLERNNWKETKEKWISKMQDVLHQEYVAVV